MKPVRRDRDPGPLLRGVIPPEVREKLEAAEGPTKPGGSIPAFDPTAAPSLTGPLSSGPFSSTSDLSPSSAPDAPPDSPPPDETPAALRRSLFSRLSSSLLSALLWIGLPVAVLVLAFAFQAGVLAACLYAFLLLVALSRGMLFFWLRRLRCEREVSEEVVEGGTTVHVTARLTNPSPWPILWLYAEESLPARFPRQGTTKRLLFLPAGRSLHLTYAATLTRRGCHQIGPLVYESGDVFGLFRRCRIDPRIDYVTVLPGYDVIEEAQLGQQRKLGDLAAVRSIFEDVTRLRGIREYRRGDPLNRIHWKTSARRGQLHSKIYDPVAEAGATVVLDFHRDAWRAARPNRDGFPVEEEAVELACTVANYLAEGGWKVGLLSNGRDPLGLPGVTMAQARAGDSLGDAMEAARHRRRDTRLAPVSIPAKRGLEQFPLIRENLGRLTLSDGLPLETVLLEELPRLDRGQVLVLITGALPAELVTAVLRARELGFRIMVFIIGNTADHDAALSPFLGAGVELFSMDGNWRIREIATGRRSL